MTEKLSAQLTIINRDSIHSIGKLEGKIEGLKVEYENAVREYNEVSGWLTNIQTVISQAEQYFGLSEKPELSITEKMKLQIYRQTMENCKINSRTDIDTMRELMKNTSERSKALNSALDDCRKKYELYSDIAKTYRELTSGDYISRLVEEERKRRESVNLAKKKSYSR